jgi:hypothetical protein
MFLEKLSESLHFYLVYYVKIYYSNIRSKIIRIYIIIWLSPYVLFPKPAGPKLAAEHR